MIKNIIFDFGNVIMKFDYKNEDSKTKMEEIKKITNNYINDRIGE